MPEKQDMEASVLVGKIHVYRPLNQTERISSAVVSVRELTNIYGRRKTVAVLENGEEVLASDIYFDCSPITAANS